MPCTSLAVDTLTKLPTFPSNFGYLWHHGVKLTPVLNSLYKNNNFHKVYRNVLIEFHTCETIYNVPFFTVSIFGIFDRRMVFSRRFITFLSKDL